MVSILKEGETKMNVLEDRFLTPKQFADRLSISRWTVYSWLQEGRLKKIKLGRLVRIPESEVDRIVQEGTQEVLD